MTSDIPAWVRQEAQAMADASQAPVAIVARRGGLWVVTPQAQPPEAAAVVVLPNRAAPRTAPAEAVLVYRLERGE